MIKMVSFYEIYIYNNKHTQRYMIEETQNSNS